MRQERFEGIGKKFTTSIRPKCLDFGSQLSLNHAFELNKFCEHIWLVFKKVNPGKSSIMINEKDIVFKTIDIINRSRSPYI